MYPLNTIILVLTGSSTPDVWTVHPHHVHGRVPRGPRGPGQEHTRGRALLDIPFQSCESIHTVSYFLNMLLEMNFNPMKNVVCGI